MIRKRIAAAAAVVTLGFVATAPAHAAKMGKMSHKMAHKMAHHKAVHKMSHKMAK